MGCSLTDPGACLSDLAGSAASSIADSAFNEIAKDFGTAAGDAVNWLWGQISGATAISLSGSAFTNDLAIVTTLAIVVATGLFLIQIIASVLRRDGGGLARGVKGLLVAFLGSVAAIAITILLLAAVDSLSAGFVEVATGDSMQQMGTAILTATSLTAVTNPAAMLLLALIVLGAVVVVWGAMMVRKLLIIVAAVFAPLAFAGATADISTSWVRRWIEMMVALIVSKLILVIIFVIGLGVLTDGLGETTGTGGVSATQTITQTIIGALILLMGGFAPWLAIKLVHFGGDQFQAVHGHAQAATAGAQTVAAAPQKIQSFAGRFGAGTSGGSGSNGSNGSPGSRASTSIPNGNAPASPTNGAPPSSPGGGPAASEAAPTSAAGIGSEATAGVARADGAAAAAGPVGGAVMAGTMAKGALDKQAAQISDVASTTGAPSSPLPAPPNGSGAGSGPVSARSDEPGPPPAPPASPSPPKSV